jgi:acetyl esterase
MGKFMAEQYQWSTGDGSNLMVFVLPQVQTFLNQLAVTRTAAPKLRDMPLALGRKSFTAMVQLADLPAPDVPWHNSHVAKVPVRIYTPRGAAPGATFLFLHGGGFVIGDLHSHHALASEIAHQLNMKLVAADYRLAPEHHYPAAHDDAFAVCGALIAGGGKVYVGGDSAGGNLAAACAQHYRKALAAQLLLYPATDYAASGGSVQDFAQGYMLEKADMEWFLGHYVPRGTNVKEPRLSPIYGDLAGLPPAVLLTCALDPLRDQGNAYAAAMMAAGVAVVHQQLEGLPHVCFQLRKAMPAAQEALTHALRDVMEISR